MKCQRKSPVSPVLSAKTKKGVIVEYWYANLGNKSQYCGMNDKGYQIVKAAKAKHTAKKYEDKEVTMQA